MSPELEESLFDMSLIVEKILETMEDVVFALSV